MGVLISQVVHIRWRQCLLGSPSRKRHQTRHHMQAKWNAKRRTPAPTYRSSNVQRDFSCSEIPHARFAGLAPLVHTWAGNAFTNSQATRRNALNADHRRAQMAEGSTASRPTRRGSRVATRCSLANSVSLNGEWHLGAHSNQFAHKSDVR